jgi:hypothetical protein
MSSRDERPVDLAISEGELQSMTRSLDEMHHESMNEVRTSMAALSDRISSAGSSIANRRAFLLGGAAVVGAGVLAACGSSSSGSGGPGAKPTASASSGSPYLGDLKVVALAAALENLAVAGYGLALANAKKGRYGAVPPAVADFVVTARKQHSDHAAAWNGVLAQSGLPKITMPSLTITPGAVAALKGAKSITEVAQIALNLENAASETYVFATANVTDAGGIATAASIAPVEAMHAAILSFVLGKYPVPNPDIGISNAVPPSALTA